MHFDDFKTDRDYRNSDGVRRKKRAGAVATHSVRLSSRPNPSRFGGRYRPSAFRDFAAPSPAFSESVSESDLN